MNKKRITPRAKGHRRQYIPHNRTSYYELLKIRSAAIKFERWRTSNVVSLIHAAKTTVAGTKSHADIRIMVREYANSIGVFERWLLLARIFWARMFTEKQPLHLNEHARSVYQRMTGAAPVMNDRKAA